MSSKRKLMTALMGGSLMALITACGAPAPLPVSPPAAVTLAIPPIVLPSPTSGPAASLPGSAAASTPFDMGGLINGTPVANWNGIPVMPGATGGGETTGIYAFNTKATAKDVVDYYIQTMQSLGFQGDPANATPGLATLYSMVFHKGQETATITVLPQADTTVVMIAK